MVEEEEDEDDDDVIGRFKPTAAIHSWAKMLVLLAFLPPLTEEATGGDGLQ